MTAPWRDERVRLIYQRPEIKASVEIILSVLMVAIMLFAAIRPTLSTVGELQKKIADQETVDSKLTTKISQLIKANEDLTTYRDQLGEFDSAIPQNPQDNEVMKRIALLATEQGLSINSISLDEVPLVGSAINLGQKDAKQKKPLSILGTDITSYKVTMDLSGSQTQVMNFLKASENMDRLIKLNSVNIKKEEIKDSKTNQQITDIRIMATGLAYYINPAGAASVSGAVLPTPTTSEQQSL